MCVCVCVCVCVYVRVRVWINVCYFLSPKVPDYYKIITEPMDLGAIMKKIDEHRYTTPKQWISDVDLITRNALE